MSRLRVIHLADLHLGFPGPHHLTISDGPDAGRPLREVDIERAAEWLWTTLPTQDPAVDVVLIAGDVFHRANPLPQAITTAARLVRQLTEAGIEVVIIDGNHDTPGALPQGSPTSYLRLFGAHVVNGNSPVTIAGNNWHNPRLREHLVVHAVPYGALRHDAWRSVQPVEGVINVLMAHGRVAGSAIPDGARRSDEVASEVLRRNWSYVALGDWHGHAFTPLEAHPAFYAGSLEALNFGEAPAYPVQPDDPYARRGALDVRLTAGQPAEVWPMPYLSGRPIVRLRPIDATHLSAEALVAELDERTRALPAEAVASLDIHSCPPSVFAALDHAAVQRARSRGRHVEVRWNILKTVVEPSEQPPNEAGLVDQWRTFIGANAATDERHEWLLSQGTARLHEARDTLIAAEEGR